MEEKMDYSLIITGIFSGECILSSVFIPGLRVTGDRVPDHIGPGNRI
jgi:hypothetical protein